MAEHIQALNGSEYDSTILQIINCFDQQFRFIFCVYDFKTIACCVWFKEIGHRGYYLWKQPVVELQSALFEQRLASVFVINWRKTEWCPEVNSEQSMDVYMIENQAISTLRCWNTTYLTQRSNAKQTHTFIISICWFYVWPRQLRNWKYSPKPLLL